MEFATYLVFICDEQVLRMPITALLLDKASESSVVTKDMFEWSA